MDRLLNSIAVACLAIVVSLVSFNIGRVDQPAAVPMRPLAAQSTFKYNPQRMLKFEIAASEITIKPSPKPHKKAAPVVVVQPRLATPVRRAIVRPTAAPPSTNSIDDLIKSVFAPLGSTAVAWALRVADCESGDNPYAVSPGGTYKGLFQFDASTWASVGGGNIFDARTNATNARKLYSQRGGAPWGCK
jgi:soluble lytic murein transglycosylase-like protein